MEKIKKEIEKYKKVVVIDNEFERAHNVPNEAFEAFTKQELIDALFIQSAILEEIEASTKAIEIQDIKQKIRKLIAEDIVTFEEKDDMSKLNEAIRTNEIEKYIEEAAIEFANLEVQDIDNLNEILEYKIYDRYI